MEQITTAVRSQQWLQMIQAQKASGLTIREWCLENNITETCFYYRQHRLRHMAADTASRFIEVTPPTGPGQVSQHLDNLNIDSAASITSGNLVIGLSNQASEELISRIVKVLNAQ